MQHRKHAKSQKKKKQQLQARLNVTKLQKEKMSLERSQYNEVWIIIFTLYTGDATTDSFAAHVLLSI